MDLLSKWIPVILTKIVSIIDASNLRSKVFDLKNEHELMWTALDDIARMYPDHKSGEFAKRTLKNINIFYGKEK